MKMPVNKAAKEIGVSDRLVYQWCADGLLRHYRFGSKPGKNGRIMIDDADLSAFLEACVVGGQDAQPAIKLKHIRLK